MAERPPINTDGEATQYQYGYHQGVALGHSEGYCGALTQVQSAVTQLLEQAAPQPVEGHLLTMEIHEDKFDRLFSAKVYYEGQLIHSDRSLDVSHCIYYAGQSIKAHMEKIGRHHKDWED